MYNPLDRSRPCPFPIKPTETYLGEDAYGYYVMDGFLDNLGTMFKRMVKFTPKSFTPGNIFKAIRNTTLTTLTSGVYLALPKSVKKTMENVANIAIPVVAGGVLAATAGPAVWGIVGPKLSVVAGALGKNVSSIGGALFDVLGKLSPSKQAQVAQQITPQDIMYSEQNGQFPPRVMQLVDEAARSDYGYAAQSVLNPLPMNASQYYADSSLYPGLQQPPEPLQDTSALAQDGWSSGEVLGVVGAASLVAYLLSRKS